MTCVSGDGSYLSAGTVLVDNIIFTCYTEIISCMVGDSMSRQPRVAGEYLHIIVRGIGKQLLFEDTSDNEKYLFFLKKYAAECRITLLAYCLMENHVHLLLRDSDSAISVFMKKRAFVMRSILIGNITAVGICFRIATKAKSLQMTPICFQFFAISSTIRKRQESARLRRIDGAATMNTKKRTW